MSFQRVEKDEALDLRSLMSKSRSFPTPEALNNFIGRKDTYIYFSNKGIVAMLGNWRKHLPSIAIWEIIPGSKVKTAVIKELTSSLEKSGFSELVSPILTEREVGSYLDAGFRIFEILARLEKRNHIVPKVEGAARLRKATREDIKSILEVEKRAFSSFWWLGEEAFIQFLVDHHFLVALLNKNVVGYNISNILKRQGVIYRLGIDPSYQGRGVGSQLLAETITWFKEKGVKPVTLTTQEGNKKGMELYRKFGFVVLSGRLYILTYSF